MATPQEMVARSPEGLGRAIRVARQSQGLTQSELAERARTNRFSIAQAENGEATKAVDVLFEALAALELELVVRPRQGWKA